MKTERASRDNCFMNMFYGSNGKSHNTSACQPLQLREPKSKRINLFPNGIAKHFRMIRFGRDGGTKRAEKYYVAVFMRY